MGRSLERFLPCHQVPSTLYGEVSPVEDREHDALVFAPAIDVTTYFQSILPHMYVAGGMRWDLAWSSAATTGSAVWGLSVMRYIHGVTKVTNLPSFGGEVTVVAPAVSPSGTITVASLSMPTMPVLAHEFYRIKLRHLGTQATIAQAVKFWVLGAENLA